MESKELCNESTEEVIKIIRTCSSMSSLKVDTLNSGEEDLEIDTRFTSESLEEIVNLSSLEFENCATPSTSEMFSICNDVNISSYNERPIEKEPTKYICESDTTDDMQRTTPVNSSSEISDRQYFGGTDFCDQGSNKASSNAQDLNTFSHELSTGGFFPKEQLVDNLSKDMEEACLGDAICNDINPLNADNIPDSKTLNTSNDFTDSFDSSGGALDESGNSKNSVNSFSNCRGSNDKPDNPDSPNSPDKKSDNQGFVDKTIDTAGYPDKETDISDNPNMLNFCSLSRSSEKHTCPGRTNNESKSPDTSCVKSVIPNRSSDKSVSPNRSRYKSDCPNGSIDKCDSPDGSKDAFDSPDRSSDTYSSPDRSTDMFGSPDRSTDMFGSPDRSTDTFDSPDRSTDTFGSPDRSTDTFGSPDRSTDTFGSPDRSTDTFGSPDRSTDTFGSPDRSTDTFGSLDRSTDTFGSPDRSTDTFGSPDRATDTFNSPDRSTDTFSSPDRSTDTFSSPDRSTDTFGSPDRSSETFDSPDCSSDTSDSSSDKSGSPERSNDNSGNPEWSSCISGILERSSEESGTPEKASFVSLGPDRSIEDCGSSNKSTDRSDNPGRSSDNCTSHGRSNDVFESPETSSDQSGNPERSRDKSCSPFRSSDNTISPHFSFGNQVSPDWSSSTLVNIYTITHQSNSERASKVKFCVKRMLEKSQIISKKTLFTSDDESVETAFINLSHLIKKHLHAKQFVNVLGVTVAGKTGKIFRCHQSNICVLKHLDKIIHPNCKDTYIKLGEPITIKVNTEFDSSRVEILKCIKSKTEDEANGIAENIDTYNETDHLKGKDTQLGSSFKSTSEDDIANQTNSITENLLLNSKESNFKDTEHYTFVFSENLGNKIVCELIKDVQYERVDQANCIHESLQFHNKNNCSDMEKQICADSETATWIKMSGSQVEDIKEYPNATENGSDWITENLDSSNQSEVSFNSMDVLKSVKVMCDSVVDTVQSYLNSIIHKAKLKISPDFTISRMTQTNPEADNNEVDFDSVSTNTTEASETDMPSTMSRMTQTNPETNSKESDFDSDNREASETEISSEQSESRAEICNLYTLFKHLSATAGTDVTADQVQEDINRQVVLDLYNGFHDLRTADYGSLELMERRIRGCLDTMQHTMLLARNTVKRIGALLCMETRTFAEMKQLNQDLNELAEDAEIYLSDIDSALSGLRDFTEDYLYYKDCISKELREFLLEDFPQMFK